MAGEREHARWFHAWRRPAPRSATRIALCSSPNVAKAPCVEAPITLQDAQRFAELAPLELEAHARAAVRAFERIGQPTRALAWAPLPTSDRSIVWRQRSARFTHYRSTVLLALKVLADAPEVDTVPAGHNCEWSSFDAIALGQRAWTTAIRHDRRLTADPPGYVGHRLYVRDDAVGVPYRELISPFESLLELIRYRVELVSVSFEAIVLAF